MIKVKIFFILCLFVLNLFGCATQGENLDESINERFVYSRLERYQLNREKYKTFESFYPEILKSFEGV